MDIMIVEKAGPGHGYYAVQAPGRHTVGVCDHITDGEATIEWYHDFFSIGGQRADDALVDFIIDREGRIAMFNDPNGTRAGWANGGVDGVEGGGRAFLARFGLQINFILSSTEHVCRAGQDWTPAMLESSIKLNAWRLDHDGMHWNSCPIHQDYGVSTHLHHGEFTGKGGNSELECAGKWYRAHESDIVKAVALEMKKYQEPDNPAPVQPPSPPTDFYPDGMNLEKCRKAFNRLRMHDVNGKVTGYNKFNPKGQVSMMWLSRARETGVFPQAQDRYLVADNDGGPTRERVTRELVTFENGDLLVRSSSRSGWNWV